LKLNNAIAVLKADISEVLQTEPHWEIFAENFKVIDHSGAELVGIPSNKFLLQSLHLMYQKFGRGTHVHVEDEHEISIARGADSALVPPVVVSGAEIPVQFQIRFGDEPVDVDLGMLFHVNDQNLVDYIKIDTWFVNGQHFHLWPGAEYTDGPLTIMSKLSEFLTLSEFAQRMAVSPDLQRFRQSIKDTSSVGPSQLIGQQAPELKVQLIGGKTRYLSDIIAEGKPLVIDFYMNF
jgi:hypothetical protein